MKYMKRDQLFNYIALVCQIIACITGIWQAIRLDHLLLMVLFLFPVIICIIFFLKYKEEIEYMHFVEYLFDNETHRFILLPKIRMYIHSRMIENKYKIDEMSVTYNISRNMGKTSEELIGDLEIIYKLKIKEKKNGRFDFVSGNDFSDCISAKYKYGTMREYMNMDLSEKRVPPYWRGYLGHYPIYIEGKNIPVDGPLEIEFKIIAPESFDFGKRERETIICLPLAFSKRIEILKYHINIDGFDDVFYSNAYLISKYEGNYRSSSIGDIERDNNSFEYVLYPDTVNGEKAYYFKIGTSEKDTEKPN